MHRLYSPSQNISDNTIIIEDKEQAHHAKNVLRLKVHEEVVIFDDKGNAYCAILEKLLPNRVVLPIPFKGRDLPKGMLFKIKDKENFMLIAKKVKITVACAIPKGSRMDEIIDKLTQLGVERIIPLETERVIVKLNKHKKILRQERWKKIALNASLQSQRNYLPVIDEVKSLEEVLKEADKFDLKIIPTLEENIKKLSLRGALATKQSQKCDCFAPSGLAMTGKVLVLIGPEGDFTPEEINLAKNAGCIPVTLGDFVLRVETAAVNVVSILNYALQ